MFIIIPTCLYELLLRDLCRIIPLDFMHDLPSIIAVGVLFLLLYLTAAYVSDLYDKQKDLLTTQIRADALDKLIGATPAGICQFGMEEDLPILAANDIYYDILGVPKEQALQNGGSVLRTMSKQSQEKVRRLREDILSGAPSNGSIEFTQPSASHETHTILAYYNYDRNNLGNVTANIVDITDRKRIEEDLRISEERYRLAFQQSGKMFSFFDVKNRTINLPRELAQELGHQDTIDDMPEHMLAQGFVEAQSVESYRQFYGRIFADEPSGDAVISWHTRQEPEKVMWYRLAFTSVFDKNGCALSAIITYEDLQEERRQRIESAWSQRSLRSMPVEEYSVAEYDLTRNCRLSLDGGLIRGLPEHGNEYDDSNAFVTAHLLCAEDRPAAAEFFDRRRLLALFAEGKSEDSLECRVQRSGGLRWVSVSVQMIRDPYSGNVLSQLRFHDIDDEKTGIVKLQRSMEEMKLELEQNRIRVMINQMQPHFLYNALSAIRTIIKTEPDYAYQLVYDFTIHLRGSIKALQSDAPIPFADELKNIKAYLNIEKMRMGDRLTFQFDIQCDSFSIIPLSIQPLAENATRHGIYPRGAAGGTMIIRSFETETAYVVEVIDDGVGFDVKEVLQTDSDSVGLENLIFRLNTLMNAEVKIISKPVEGTRVTVTIPKREGKNENDFSR